MSKKTSLNKALFLTAIGIILIAGGWFLMTKTKLGDPTLPQAVVDAADVTTPLTSGEQTLMAASTTPETITQTDNAAPNAAAVPPNKTAPVVQPEGRFLGRTDAPVQIIEFSSLTCSHCAYFHNEILNDFRVKYIDTGLVRIEFREFPLNKPALDATMVLRCLPDKQYFPFMSMLFQTQDHWAFSNDYAALLKQNAKLAGLSESTFNKCVNDQAAVQKLAENIKADAEKYKIESTPTFIINDGAARVVGALPVDEFGKQIAPFLPQTK